MSNQKTDSNSKHATASPRAADAHQEAHPDAANCGAAEAVCEHLRSSIRRLQAELADRESQARPMPSSVMRAYQKLIDRHLLALDAETAKSSPK